MLLSWFRKFLRQIFRSSNNVKSKKPRPKPPDRLYHCHCDAAQTRLVPLWLKGFRSWIDPGRNEESISRSLRKAKGLFENCPIRDATVIAYFACSAERVSHAIDFRHRHDRDTWRRREERKKRNTSRHSGKREGEEGEELCTKRTSSWRIRPARTLLRRRRRGTVLEPRCHVIGGWDRVKDQEMHELGNRAGGRGGTLLPLFLFLSCVAFVKNRHNFRRRGRDWHTRSDAARNSRASPSSADVRRSR